MTATTHRILVAEDHPVLARVIQFNLEQAGYSVTVACNGREAIEYLSTESFALLLTDYQMPISDGAAVCDFVRQTQHNAQLPIILCSAKGLELNAVEVNARWQSTRPR